MGLAQSHADFFHDANEVDGDQIEIDDYLRCIEQSLWRHKPSWHRQQQQQPHDHVTNTGTSAYLNGTSVVAAASSNEPLARVVSAPAKPLVRTTCA